tara:strand:- start:746 stop:997 length:252 start_codon:yes stop_codon:yes gene_type:complete
VKPLLLGLQLLPLVRLLLLLLVMPTLLKDTWARFRLPQQRLLKERFIGIPFQIKCMSGMERLGRLSLEPELLLQFKWLEAQQG